MVLMFAVARAARSPSTQVGVATFDHGTGAAATAAADLVVREATRLGLEVCRGHADAVRASEAEWRSARWAFLRAEAIRGASRVSTAHTRDDQVETVVLRALRGAGPRGLAGLLATSDVVRPFLNLPRRALAEYARQERVAYLDDPTNESRAYLRNRVRHDLLPAIRQVRPQFDEEVLAVARRAAVWRSDVEALAERYVLAEASGELRVARPELATYDSAALCMLWPAILARVGATADRRGTLRLAQFTTSGKPGARIQLSGDFEVLRDRDTFLVHRQVHAARPPEPIRLSGLVELGRWRFTPLTAGAGGRAGSEPSGTDLTATAVADPWTAEFSADSSLTVRAWRSGDRMRREGSQAARRVKRFFADARVPGPVREGWPIVEADGEVAWIPGVRRGSAATARSGRPVIRYRCERLDG